MASQSSGTSTPPASSLLVRLLLVPESFDRLMIPILPHRYQHTTVLRSLLWLQVGEKDGDLEARRDGLCDGKCHGDYPSTRSDARHQGIPTPEETEGPYYPPVGFWQKLAAILF